MKVLVVAAHPDDEVLGCGGLVARHADAGDVVHVFIVAEGATSRDLQRDPGKRAGELVALRAAAGRAAEILGAQAPRFGGLPDNRLDGLPLLDVIKIIEAVGAEIRPEIVYTHHAGDLNIDHGVVARAVATAFRPMPGAGVRAIYAFETISSTEWGMPGDPAFRPNRFVDVSAAMVRKVKALEAYESEMRPFPHARSIAAVEALARFRGASVGLAAAEALVVIRDVVR